MNNFYHEGWAVDYGGSLASFCAEFKRTNLILTGYIAFFCNKRSAPALLGSSILLTNLSILFFCYLF